MKRIQPWTVLALALGLALVQLRPAASSDLPADQAWKKAEQRIKSMRDYTLGCNTSSPSGYVVFDYAVIRPDSIRTRILQGERAKIGVVYIYKPSEFGDCVEARKGVLQRKVSLSDPAIRNTPVVRPVFDMLVEAVRDATMITSAGGDVIFGHAVYLLDIETPQGRHRVAVDKGSFDVLRWSYDDSRGHCDRIFYNIHVNTTPSITF